MENVKMTRSIDPQQNQNIVSPSRLIHSPASLYNAAKQYLTWVIYPAFSLESALPFSSPFPEQGVSLIMPIRDVSFPIPSVRASWKTWGNRGWFASGLT